MENYVLMQKPETFLVVTLDATEADLEGLEAELGGAKKEPLSASFEDLDLPEITKAYGITEEEAKLRNGVINGVLNQIVLKNLR